MPTDLDGIVESDGHFLVMEWKREGAAICQAQNRMLREMRLTGVFSDLIIWGNADKAPIAYRFDPEGERMDSEKRACDLEQLRTLVSMWSETFGKRRKAV